MKTLKALLAQYFAHYDHTLKHQHGVEAEVTTDQIADAIVTAVVEALNNADLIPQMGTTAPPAAPKLTAAEKKAAKLAAAADPDPEAV